MEKLSILIPCYNERATIGPIVRRVLAAPPADLAKEVVVVDDCSRDGTREILAGLAKQHPELKVIYHEKNKGKGSALATAQGACTGDYVIIQDADLEYDPETSFEALLAPIRDGRGDVVFGSRFAGGRERRVLFFWHEIANRILTMLSNMATNLNLTDMETCYKAFRGNDFRSIPLESPRFGFEPEITAKVARLGLRVYEVPISYHGRTYEAGKKIGWKDGVSAVWTILWYWMFDGLSRMDGMLSSLLALRAAGRFNRWMFDTIQPYVGRRVLEAGCGIGNLTAFLQQSERVVAVDYEPSFVAKVTQEFARAEHITVRQMDLTDTAAVEALASEHLDTVVCLNVIEHLEPAVEVLQSFHKLLVPGGRAIILVPQGQELFGTMDEAVGHFRRYDEASLREIMEAGGFEVEAMLEFNRAASPGWWFNGRVLGKTYVSPAQVRLYDKLIPLVRRIDPLLPLPPLSLIAIGKKAEA